MKRRGRLDPLGHSGTVTIRRFDDEPDDLTVLGRVAVVKLPFDIRRVAPKGTWLEEDEDIF